MTEKTPREAEEELAEKMMTPGMTATFRDREAILEKREELKIESLKHYENSRLALGTQEKPEVMKATVNGHDILLVNENGNKFSGWVDDFELSESEAEKLWFTYHGLDWDKHNKRSQDKLEWESAEEQRRETNRQTKEGEEKIKKTKKDLGI